MRTAIIGGGAAGLFAACVLGRAGAKAVLLERQARVGRKLLSTGNGRCNLSNLGASPRDYHGEESYVRAALNALSPRGAMAFFEEIGLVCAPDEAGRVYPLSNQAAGVLDALRLCAAECGVETRTEFDARAIRRRGRGYAVESAGGERVEADFVVVACGGPAAPKLGGGSGGHALLRALGHKISPCLPAIAALKTDAEAVRALKGIRMAAELTLLCDGRARRREAGEALFGEGAVSGIAAMQLAREANLALKRGESCALRLNFLPGAAADFIEARAATLPERAMEDFLSGVVPKRLGQVLVKSAGVQPLSLRAKDLDSAQRAAIRRALTGWELPVRGSLGFDQAQVCCGGAELSDFDVHTLESRRAPGVFAAGEVLNVDGDCGGFNLQWAWASAALCAREILRRQGRDHKGEGA